jgi:hypothetical protein
MWAVRYLVIGVGENLKGKTQGKFLRLGCKCVKSLATDAPVEILLSEYFFVFN